MNKYGLNEIRRMYLDFFAAHGHKILPSFSLVPHHDKSILLINAGMTPMKDWFTGAAVPPSRRVTTCQKCIRTPDIENVGKTARHGTYFEMMGNFSFGDYFKKEAIALAYEFSTKHLCFDPARIHVTVHKDDDEAYHLWKDMIGLPESHITKHDKDNFWEHGTGPCGPCSELFYDRGEAYGCGKPDCGVDCGCDRFVEYWNLVFSEFNHEKDGSYTPLKQKNIDTGAGLERMAALSQNVGSLFEVDTIREVLDTVCAIAHKTYGASHETDVAIRVITDHVRSSVMMIGDHILPSNEGRGYVLRRLIRRAVRYGKLIGISRVFLAEVAEIVIKNSVEFYPELQSKDRILRILTQEETRFHKTLDQGLSLLQEIMQQTKAKSKNILTGEDVFKLHDTFGFPVDLTVEIAAENGLEVDTDGFDALMQKQKSTSRKASKALSSSAWNKLVLPDKVKKLDKTVFDGYETLESTSDILAILKIDENADKVFEVDTAEENDALIILVKNTPFYAESGGQSADQGEIRGEFGHAVVNNVQKTANGLFLHYVEVKDGYFTTGDSVLLKVDAMRRQSIARNHTATHLLHKALQTVLGSHVSQKGSAVTEAQLRFDFQHDAPLTAAEIANVEAIVNAEILKEDAVHTEIMSFDAARKTGAMAFFDDKYGDVVRVVFVGDFSKELCGGTHLKNSVEVLSFRIISESSIAAGVRRIEAVTGKAALEAAERDRSLLRDIRKSLKATSDADILTKLMQIEADNTRLVAEIEQIEHAKIMNFATNMLAHNEKIGEFDAVLAKVEDVAVKDLRTVGDFLRQKLGGMAVIVLASVSKDKISWLAMAGKEAVESKFDCGVAIKTAAALTGGKGGGRKDMAQAGAVYSSKVDEALRKIKEMLQQIA